MSYILDRSAPLVRCGPLHRSVKCTLAVLHLCNYNNCPMSVFLPARSLELIDVLIQGSGVTTCSLCGLAVLHGEDNGGEALEYAD